MIYNVTHFSTKGAGVSSVLGNFNFFNHFSQRSTISCSIFSYNSDLFCTLSLEKIYKEIIKKSLYDDED